MYLLKDKIPNRNILGITSQVSPSPTFFEPRQVVLNYKDKQINVGLFEADSAKTFLVPNFKDKLTSTEAKDKYQCKNLVNGGFYSKNEQSS